MSPQLALYLYRVVFVAFIVWASAKTFAEGWPVPHGTADAPHLGRHIRWLAGAEIVAALAFLWPAAQLWAGGALVAIFAIATVLDLRMGGVPARFAYYSATVLILAFLEPRLRTAA
jgi:hypothetical protein